MLAFLSGAALGVVVGGLLVIVFGKNNKSHVDQARNEVVNAYGQGEAALKALLDSWKNK